MTAPTTRETADHAELARLAECLHGPHEWGYRDPVEGGFIEDDRPYRASDALETLLSEIAALRGERELTLSDGTMAHCSEDAWRWFEEWRARFEDDEAKRTQAERQRDELRKALEPSPEMIRVGAWRAKLHREANPGDTWEDTAREVFTIMVAASDAIANQGAE